MALELLITRNAYAVVGGCRLSSYGFSRMRLGGNRYQTNLPLIVIRHYRLETTIMNATLTRSFVMPAGISEAIISSTEKQLKSYLGSPFAPFAELEIEFRAANAEALAVMEAEALEARKQDLITNGIELSIGHVSYAELLQIASLMKYGSKKNPEKKNWYGLSYSTLPEPYKNLVNEVHDALEGIQNREANALKAAIAETA